MRFSTVMLAALMSVGAGSAMAQPYWGGEYPRYYGGPRYYDPGERDYGREGPSEYDGISLREIHGALRSRGLRALSHPMRRGDRYVVMARDGYGRTQRVVIDAETGDIMRVVAARPHVDDPAIRERDPAGPPPLPPLNRPRANAPERPAAPPQRTAPQHTAPQAAKPKPQQSAKADPSTPPMPRARPGDAPPNSGKPANKPSRVILPGGPAPKEDRTAGRSYVPPTPQPAAEPTPAPAPPEASPPAPVEAAPAPAAPTETPAAPSAGAPDARIPPAQAF